MREHDRLFKRYSNENNKVTKHGKYKNARNVVIFKVKQSKKECQNYFQKHSKNVIKTQGGVKSIVTLKSKDKTTPNSLMVNGNIITNRNCIAEIFNDFFVNVGSRLQSFLTKYEQKAVWFQKRPLYKPCIDLINKYFDNDYFVCGVFINLQKAFDTINHEILLVKLDFYDIRGLANSWLKSFFENRKQYVSLPGQSSSVKTVACDVSQGST